VPLVSPIGFSFDHTGGEELTKRAAGIHIYNQFLADAVSAAPERLFPAVLLPMWDVDASIAELNWCREHGLRVISFSAPRPGIRSYDDPYWEPFWSACEDAEAVLATHSGAIDLQGLIDGAAGPHSFCLVELEAGGWLARRALSRLVFSGVFERHPRLRFLLSEQNGEWWSATVREYDSSYVNHRHMVRDQMPEPPSFYLKRNVFIGGSFMAPFEAEWAVEQGYWENLLWGRDFPHMEGTWSYQTEAEAADPERNVTHLAMRNTFAGIAPAKVLAIMGANAVRAFGLDEAALRQVADRINAPTLDELAKPIDAVPEHGGILAFRTVGAWW
jgi:predicted TIM-barrel fold metal-dependent hydrolase